MFGFLAPSGSDVSYRSLYSRCCQHQRHHYGMLSLPMLSYESVFLYALGLDVGLGGDFEPPLRRCCMLRTDGMGGTLPDAGLGEFVATVGVLLASVKLEDDIRDTRSRTARWFRQWVIRVFDHRFAKANKFFERHNSDFISRLSNHLLAHLAAENAVSRLDAEDFSRATSAAFEDLFAQMSNLPSASRFVHDFREIGRHVGTAIVLHDCATDWESDLRQELPNPIRDVQSAHRAAYRSREALAAAKDATIAIAGESGRSSSILAAVERRLASNAQVVSKRCMGGAPGIQCEQPHKQGVVLHATCCCPCGDGAIAFDSKEAESCCGSLCLGACVWICICSCLCSGGK